MNKTILKKVLSITLVIVAISLNLVVYAQVIVTQIYVNEKIKEFLKIDSIEIISNYIEGEINIYKVHDSINDRYYKLALDKDEKIDWYDVVKYGNLSKIDNGLSKKLEL